LPEKAALIRAGAARLIQMGIPETKKLLFYESIWRRGNLDLDTGRPRHWEPWPAWARRNWEICSLW